MLKVSRPGAVLIVVDHGIRAIIGRSLAKEPHQPDLPVVRKATCLVQQCAEEMLRRRKFLRRLILLKPKYLTHHPLPSMERV